MGQDLGNLTRLSWPFLPTTWLRPILLLQPGGFRGLARDDAPRQFPVGTAPSHRSRGVQGSAAAPGGTAQGNCGARSQRRGRVAGALWAGGARAGPTARARCARPGTDRAQRGRLEGPGIWGSERKGRERDVGGNSRGAR